MLPPYTPFITVGGWRVGLGSGGETSHDVFRAVLAARVTTGSISESEPIRQGFTSDSVASHRFFGGVEGRVGGTAKWN